jgi:hypothetical protein
MNADRTTIVILTAFIFIFLLASCGPAATSTPFVPPAQPTPTQNPPTTTPVPSAVSAPTLTPTIGPCANDLTFVDDLTIKDGTVVAPGSPIDKQWLVTNSGSCNWDSSYRLKWIGGDPLGAAAEQLLYPARAGTQAILRILFTAPAAPGTYQSVWQAYGPDGAAFGDWMGVQIIVSP